MSYDLLAWNAWARNATPDEIAEKLTQQQAEVARLRSMCMEAADEVGGMRDMFVSETAMPKFYGVATKMMDRLTAAGKEATDGQ